MRVYQAKVFIPILIFVMLVSCKNPSGVVNREAEVLDRSWKIQSEVFASRPIVTLSWRVALVKLVERNPDIQKAVENRARAKRGISQVYRNLLPALQLSAGVNKKLAELNNLTSNDLNFNLNAYAFLSGLLNLNKDIYAAELTYLRAMLVEEATKREKIVDLYRLFVASDKLVEARRRLQDLGHLSEIAGGSTVESGSSSSDASFVKTQLVLKKGQMETDLAKLFAQTDCRIELEGSDLPPVDYFRKPLPVENVARTGVLRRKLDAIELIGAQARVEGVKLQYWPDVNFFLTSGTIWSTSNGQTIFFNSRDAQLSANIQVPIDINGYIGNQLRDAKKDMQFVKENVALREGLLQVDFANKSEELAEVESNISLLERKRRVLLQLISVEGVDNLGKRLGQLFQIESAQAGALDKRAELNAFFLFFDEAFWMKSASGTFQAGGQIQGQ